MEMAHRPDSEGVWLVTHASFNWSGAFPGSYVLSPTHVRPLSLHPSLTRLNLTFKDELPETTHLEWERVVDFPHGSLRLLGSRKANHMDFDPAWVGDKVGAYTHAWCMSGCAP